MTKPTTTAATPQRGAASGKKANPPETVEGDGGLVRGPTNEPDEVTLPAQQENHNDQNDRGGTKIPADGQQTQESIEADPGWKRSASTLNASPQREHVTQHTFIAWQRQVLFDRELNIYARAILSAFAAHAVGRVSEATEPLYVEPVPQDVWSSLGISKSSYYRYINDAEESGWIEKAGSFEYKTGERTELGDAYLIVMKKDNISP